MNKYTLNTVDYVYEDMRRLDAALAEHLFGYKWCTSMDREYILEGYFVDEHCGRDNFLQLWELGRSGSNTDIDAVGLGETYSHYAPDKWHRWHMPVIFEMGSLGYDMNMTYSPLLQQEIGEGFRVTFQKDPDVNVRDYGTCKSDSDSVAICQAALTALGVDSPFKRD